MTAADLITPDFRARRWVSSDGAARESACAQAASDDGAGDGALYRVHTRPVAPVDLPPPLDARRAPARPHLTDDYGIPAEAPELIAELLMSLEAAPWRAPVIRVVAGLDRIARVHVAHGALTFHLAAPDARLAAAALDQEQAFAGCSGLAAELCAAANRADWARPYRRADRLQRRGPTPLRQRIEGGSGGLTLRLFLVAGLLLGLAVFAARLAEEIAAPLPAQAASVRDASVGGTLPAQAGADRVGAGSGN